MCDSMFWFFDVSTTELKSLLSGIRSDFSRTVLYLNSARLCEVSASQHHMVRRIMHRISAGPASQRSASVSFCHRTALRHLVVQRPSVTSRRRLLETVFSVLSTNFADAGAGGPSDVLPAFGLLRSASGRSRDGAPPTVTTRALQPLVTFGALTRSLQVQPFCCVFVSILSCNR